MANVLLRSRETKLDAPEYLEGLIAYYRGEYDAALKHAEVAAFEAPLSPPHPVENCLDRRR
jgi:hypothetical protein